MGSVTRPCCLHQCSSAYEGEHKTPAHAADLNFPRMDSRPPSHPPAEAQLGLAFCGEACGEIWLAAGEPAPGVSLPPFPPQYNTTQHNLDRDFLLEVDALHSHLTDRLGDMQLVLKRVNHELGIVV